MPTQVSKTVASGGGGDYTSITSAFNAVSADLITSDENWTITITDSSTYTENAAIDRYTGNKSDATRSVKLTVTAGQTPQVTVAGGSGATGIDFAVNYGVVEKIKVSTATGQIGIKSGGTDNIVQDCTVTGSGTNTGTGVQLRTATHRHYVLRCKLHNLLIGIDDIILADDSELVNNLMYNVSSVGIQLRSGSNDFLIYHNTIRMVSNGNAIIFANTSTPVNTFKNNIFEVVNGRCLNGGSTANTAGIVSDNNRFNVTGTGYVGRFNGTDYTTLANWQSAASEDANSASGTPSWTNPGSDDYTLTASDDGESGLGVTVDYTSTTRADPGDRGCYEFVVAAATGRVFGNMGMSSAGFGGGYGGFV